ncbi:prostacyclin receptor-like [Clavelina lepadiformis]|uniref:prostacyclin receptor-like n=1 Tax=Clavelina lepadiformis TaxID=159417 RepID=UPI004041B6BE
MDQNNSTIYALMNETNGMATTDTAGSFPTGPRHLAIDAKSGIAIPIVMFCLGVFSNILAIGILLHYKVKGNPQHTSMSANQCNYQPSRDLEASAQDLRVEGSRRPSSASPSQRRRSRSKMKFGAFHTLVLTLAILDLTGTLFTSPLTFLLYGENIHIEDYGGVALCHYSAFAMLFFGFSTMAMVMAMSVERLLSIRHPYYYHNKATPKKAIVASLAILFATAILCSLPSLGFGEIRPMYPHSWCFANWNATEPKDQAFNYLYVVLGICMLIVTLVCNTSVIKGLVNMKKSIKPVSKYRRRKFTVESQMIIQLLVITSIFVICWLPLMIRILINQLGHEKFPEGDRVAVWLVAANPVLDPWVYILFRSTVKRQVLGVLRKLFCRKPQRRDSSSWVSKRSSPQYSPQALSSRRDTRITVFHPPGGDKSPNNKGNYLTVDSCYLKVNV